MLKLTEAQEKHSYTRMRELSANFGERLKNTTKEKPEKTSQQCSALIGLSSLNMAVQVKLNARGKIGLHKWQA